MIIAFHNLIHISTDNSPQIIKKNVFFAYLHSCFGEVGFHGDFLPSVDVWVVGLGEGFLQLLELGAGECRPYTALLPFLRVDGRLVTVLVHLVRQAGRYKQKTYH